MQQQEFKGVLDMVISVQKSLSPASLELFNRIGIKHGIVNQDGTVKTPAEVRAALDAMK